RDKKKNKLTPDQQQKMLNLSLLYDSKIRGGQIDRFTQLARLLSVFTIRNLLARKSDVLFGIAGLFVAIVFIKLALFKFDALQLYLVLAAFITLVAGLIPGWNRSRRSRKAAQQCFDAIMVLPTDANEQNSLCCAFRSLPGDRFKNLILPRAFDGNERNAPPAEENRYKYLQFFQDIIVISGYTGILVFVDQVDEPTMVHGDPKKMWAFIRSMMDNKLLSVKNMGIKFLLFRGLHKEYQREEDGFLSKSRLDKQNVVWSLEWGGANLLDLANHRLADCLVDPGKATDVKSLFDKCLHDRLVSEFGNCRTPRKLFEFLNTTIKIHISKHPSSEPVYIINETSFELAKKECRDP
ncbi:MAG: hypothetical protein FWG74_09560, partial [Planctomycetes bacterium]|nr:hypothetical protein [Planctomycetota bacterium]